MPSQLHPAFITETQALFQERMYCEYINDDFTHDEMTEYGKFMPDMVVEAITTKEVSQLMKLASRYHVPIIPRGAGTGLCGGCVAVGGGVVLSLAKMNRILEIDSATMSAKVECGVLLCDFAKALSPYKLFYAPDPGEKTATLGGNVSTNAGGMRAVKYGVTRQYILQLTAVLPSGEILSLGGKIMKNSSGYSLKDLLIGSEGTLAIITEITVKLLPVPGYSQSLLVPFADIDACIHTVPAILRSPYTPTALEYMEKTVIETAQQYLGSKFPDTSADAYLLLLFDGTSRQQVEEVSDAVSALCLENGAKDVFIVNTEERHDVIWNARSAFLEAIKNSTTEMDECDVVVPCDQIAIFVKQSKRIAAKHHIRIQSFGHAGDGNLHLYILKDALSNDVWEQKRSAIMQELYDQAALIGGLVSGEHGIGHAKTTYLEESLKDVQIQLMQAIKAVFDPLCILNPGKVLRKAK